MCWSPPSLCQLLRRDEMARVRKQDGSFASEQSVEYAVTVESRIEDLVWMDSNGETLIGAAKRLGLTVDTVERTLARAGLRELTRSLRSRNPERVDL